MPRSAHRTADPNLVYQTQPRAYKGNVDSAESIDVLVVVFEHVFEEILQYDCWRPYLSNPQQQGHPKRLLG